MDLFLRAYFLCAAGFSFTAAICHVSTPPLDKIKGEVSSSQGNYNDNQNCLWLFKPRPIWNTLVIDLDPFAISSGSDENACNEDVLIIDGIKFCGEVNMRRCLVFSDATSNLNQCIPPIEDGDCEHSVPKKWPPNILFISDETFTDRGFSLSYSFHTCTQISSAGKVPFSLEPDRRRNNKAGQVPATKPPVTSPNPSKKTTRIDVAGTDNKGAADYALMIIIVLCAVILLLGLILVIVLGRKRLRHCWKMATEESAEQQIIPGPNEYAIATDGVYETIRDVNVVSNSPSTASQPIRTVVDNVLYNGIESVNPGI